jgi:hypothetical protein
MTPTPRTLTAAVVVVGLLLTGCTSDPTPTTNGSPTTSASASSSASASPSASPSPSSTLSAAKQKAVDEATAVVLAYEQMLEDIPADPEPYLNDLNNVATQPQLDLDLRSLQDAVVAIAQGKLVIEDTGPVTLASVEPVKVDLKGEPPTVTLEVCVDKTGTRSTYEDKPVTGSRQLIRYRVVKTTYLPDPGWAVAKVLPPAGFDQPQPC